MFDDFLRKRAQSLGATLINGLFMNMDLPSAGKASYTISYNDYDGGEKARTAPPPLPLSPVARRELSSFLVVPVHRPGQVRSAKPSCFHQACASSPCRILRRGADAAVRLRWAWPRRWRWTP